MGGDGGVPLAKYPLQNLQTHLENFAGMGSGHRQSAKGRIGVLGLALDKGIGLDP